MQGTRREKELELQLWSPRQQLLVASLPEMPDIGVNTSFALSTYFITGELQGSRETDSKKLYSRRGISYI